MNPTIASLEAPHAPPIVPDDIPIIYEDEVEPEMGESNIHVLCNQILHVCVAAHMAARDASVQVFNNMNVYYRDKPVDPKSGQMPYISPDCFAVHPYQLLPKRQKSYKIGTHGPAPFWAAEVVSETSALRRDFQEKPIIYAKLKVAELLLVDETGDYLPERLLLKRLQSDGTFRDERDADGGVTSQFGFRVLFDAEGLQVIDGASGQRYVRPGEAQAQAKQRLAAEEARQRAEEARQRAEEERRRETEGRLRAEEERRREAEARRRAEDERQREAAARQTAETRLQDALMELKRLKERPTPPT